LVLGIDHPCYLNRVHSSTNLPCFQQKGNAFPWTAKAFVSGHSLASGTQKDRAEARSFAKRF
jgi:hypothetical protein